MKETRKQKEQRRMDLGFNNPKKDWWAKRKSNRARIPMMDRLEPMVVSLKPWQKVYVVLVLGFKRLWRKLFGKADRKI